MIKFTKQLRATSKSGRQVWKWRVEIDGEFRAEIHNVSFGWPEYHLLDTFGNRLGTWQGTRAKLAEFEQAIRDNLHLIPTAADMAKLEAERQEAERKMKERCRVTIARMYAAELLQALSVIAMRYADPDAIALVQTISAI